MSSCKAAPPIPDILASLLYKERHWGWAIHLFYESSAQLGSGEFGLFALFHKLFLIWSTIGSGVALTDLFLINVGKFPMIMKTLGLY